MITERQAYLLDLPQTAYNEIHQLQIDCVNARRHGRLDRDLIIVVEHPPVFTLGRRGDQGNLLVPEEELKARGIAIIPVERGGDITYHGPGQLVVYPIVDLNQAKAKVVEFVDALENAMVRTAGDWGIAASGNKQARGAWVAGRKMGSVGITIRRGVSFHGLALNVNTDLTPFSWVNPCGIAGCTMTSMALETSKAVTMAAVRKRLPDHLARALGLTPMKVDADTILRMLS